VRPSRDHAKRIDHRVPRDGDVVSRDPLGHEIVAGVRGGGEVRRGHHRGHAAIRFLRKGAGQVVGAKPSLHVPHRNPLIEGGERGGGHRGGITLHEDVGRALAEEGFGEGGHGARREDAQLLPVLHQLEVDVGRDAESPQRLTQHLAVLGRGQHERLEPGMIPEGRIHRGHLDGFGSGPNDKRDA